jgi:hypothetical protein
MLGVRGDLLGARISSGEPSAICSAAVAVVQATENRHSMDSHGQRRLCRRKPLLTSRRLQAQTTMGSPIVVTHVLAQQSLSLAIVPQEQVIEAVAAQRSQ